jgi:ADP-ribosylglycohydrolase
MFMADILDYSHRAIEAGHQVYVHCRAGIGRTNTVVGCWLRREGLSGLEAIDRLNLLWRANARSRSWPRVPETPEQLRYVMEWREPDADGALGLDLASARVLRERYQGAMQGLACGDAMGATLQFRQVGQFTPIADLLSGGHWQLPRGAWTDDTSMALCLAESLLECDGADIEDQRSRYRRWQREGYRSSTGSCIGITAAVAAALQDGAAGAAVPHIGGGAGAAGVAGAGGVQPLTRVGIAALFSAAAPDRAMQLGLAAVELTDAAPRLKTAARYYVCFMIAALRGAVRDTLTAEARAFWANELIASLDALDRSREPSDFETFVQGAEGAAAAPASGAASDDPVAVLQRIVGAVLAAAGFREGLLAIVNQGGDSDVHGALYGQLAGALYGSPGIPRAWTSALLRREVLSDMADRLLVAALTPGT